LSARHLWTVTHSGVLWYCQESPLCSRSLAQRTAFNAGWENPVITDLIRPRPCWREDSMLADSMSCSGSSWQEEGGWKIWNCMNLMSLLVFQRKLRKLIWSFIRASTDLLIADHESPRFRECPVACIVGFLAPVFEQA
jgi:hypothetical protein